MLGWGPDPGGVTDIHRISGMVGNSYFMQYVYRIGGGGSDVEEMQTTDGTVSCRAIDHT